MRYFWVGQLPSLQLPGYSPPSKFAPPAYDFGPVPQSAARFPYPHNYQNMDEQPSSVQSPHILWLLDPSGKLVAGGEVYAKDTAEYLYNLWLTQYRYLPNNSEIFLWRYSGTYDNAHLPRFMLRRAQLLTYPGGTKSWHSLPPQYCSKAYCPK